MPTDVRTSPNILSSGHSGTASDGTNTGKGQGDTPEQAGQAALADLERQQREAEAEKPKNSE